MDQAFCQKRSRNEVVLKKNSSTTSPPNSHLGVRVCQWLVIPKDLGEGGGNQLLGPFPFFLETCPL